MKNIFPLLAALFVLTFTACNKDDKKDANKLVFTINGVSDQTYSENMQIPLEIGYTSGTQEPVTLSVTGLPAGMTGRFSSVSGTPKFTTVLTLAADEVKPGTYAVIVTGTSTSGSTTSVNMKLTVPDYEYQLVGRWKKTSQKYTQYDASNNIIGQDTQDVSASQTFYKFTAPNKYTVEYEGTETENGTWTTSAGKITFTISSGSTDTYSYTISGTKLTLTQEFTLGGSRFVTEETYVKQ